MAYPRPNKKRLGIDLDEEFFNAIKAIAVERKISLVKLATRALLKYLNDDKLYAKKPEKNLLNRR